MERRCHRARFSQYLNTSEHTSKNERRLRRNCQRSWRRGKSYDASLHSIITATTTPCGPPSADRTLPATGSIGP